MVRIKWPFSFLELNALISVVFFFNFLDSFSDEEDEFIMADNDEDGGDGDEDNHGVGGPGNEIGQGDMQNLHINGKYSCKIVI